MFIGEGVVQGCDGRKPVNRLSSEFGHPVSDANSPIFQDQVLEFFKIVSLVIIRLNLLNEKLEEVHVVCDFLGFFDRDSFYHYFGR